MGAAGVTQKRRTWIIALAAALVVGMIATVWVLNQPAAPASAPSPRPTIAATPTPTPTPTPTGHPANTASYDIAALPQINVFTVLNTLPTDDDPYGAFTGVVARSVAEGAPVFADPTGEPVAYLPRDYMYDGTTVPVVEQEANWVRVLLVGRESLPSQGNPAQVMGWLRMQDVELTPLDTVVEVSVSARTVDIVQAGVSERIATDFAWGTEQTPTPLGRSFIMTIRTEPSLTYTRGNPIVYLSVQSPTLDGFGGAKAAITAFHYHDVRSGAVSNGCLRVAPEVTARLAQLPLGTPVIIRA